MLLPRITALGALDEAPLALTGALDLPPAVEPMQRLAALSTLILAMDGAGGAPRSADRAWLLARELASLMDEAERAGIDLAQRLPDAAEPDFAEHWAKTLKFLQIVTAFWPAWLAENGVMNPAARQVALLEAQAAAWEDDPPDYPVLIAGTTAGIPAVARLLRVVARLPLGQVVLPQLDTGMSDEAWAGAGTVPRPGRVGAAAGGPGCDARRCAGLGERFAGDGSGNPVSAAVAGRCCRPPRCTTGWSAAPVSAGGAVAAERGGSAAGGAIHRAGAAGGAGNPGRPGGAGDAGPRPCRAGGGGAAALRHRRRRQRGRDIWPTRRPPCSCACWCARWPRNSRRCALLALLKHPLAAAGLSPVACREAARTLEKLCLRGPKPLPGIAGLRLAVDREAGAASATAAFLSRVEACLEPALRFELGDGDCSGRGAGRCDRGGRAAGGDGRYGRPRAALGGGGRRGPGGAAGRAAGGGGDHARSAAAACCPGCWTRCWPVRWSAAAGPCAGAAGSNIRGFSSGACWRRGCNRSIWWCWAGWRRRSGRRWPSRAPGCRARCARASACRRRRRRWVRRRMISWRRAARRRGWCCPVPCGATTPRRCRRGG